MTDNVFIEGMMYKPPRENAPDFVKGSISVKLKDFFEFAKKNQNDGWLNIDMKVSKGGKLYFALNTWKPEKKEGWDSDTGTGSDQIPF